jgi:hypothetical protein
MEDLVRLASGELVPGDRSLKGEKLLAYAFGWKSAKSLQRRLTGARKHPAHSNFWLRNLAPKGGTICVFASRAMLIYRTHVLATKVRFAPHPPRGRKALRTANGGGSGAFEYVPGRPDRSRRRPFASKYDEELYVQAEREWLERLGDTPWPDLVSGKDLGCECCEEWELEEDETERMRTESPEGP